MTQMNSLVMRDGAIHLETTDVPVPASGQVLVKSLACGICGSDLHLTRHYKEIFEFYKLLGMMSDQQDEHTSIMLGHEYCAEIVSYGPETQQTLPLGSKVTSVPFLMTQNNAAIGVTPGLSGAYSEYFIMDEVLLLPVPDHVPAAAAALTEPLAVGLHSVNRSGIEADDVALVTGCGPIGLAVISALHQRGIKNIIASDMQAEKLAMAESFGAQHVVNPKDQDEMQLAASVAGDRKVVIFECIGIPRIIKDFIERCPPKSTLVVTGIHTSESSVNYAYATVKELDLKFSYYYTPEEFAECLSAIADGKVHWQSLLTAKVGIDGVNEAFEVLSGGSDQIKVIIEPWRTGKLEAQ
ncbi:zinc-binding dehydrogenase [Aestuariicella hydrocarbonica]|uniref:Zinc-binding dehydrogenase n=1 Tax=Pseudomaricurvus hydrocarbonicus TaxID=1470433 RepID=A0A9E5JW64_9GAMM|nr:zinc-binding dehydrogenase [Aestuariicella hydrocarbonica]NHO66379.1 zinc-binding dehydrogenase [Aestuariicella hydrocarbonica]